MKGFALVLPATLLLAALAVASCGGDEKPSPTTRPPAATSAPATATAPPATAVTVASPTPAGGATGATTITIGDYNYSPNQVSARTGQPVRLALSNGGQEPHTFTIDGVVDSGTLAGGGRGNVEFTPTQAGTLAFYCTIHGRAAMSGTVSVQ